LKSIERKENKIENGKVQFNVNGTKAPRGCY